MERVARNSSGRGGAAGAAVGAAVGAAAGAAAGAASATTKTCVLVIYFGVRIQ